MVDRKLVSADRPWERVVGYSRAVAVGQVVEVSGTAAADDNGKILAKGDYVTVVSTSKGTNTGPLMGMPATGKPAEIGSIDVWLVRDGRLAEAWHVEQLLQMMMQLGTMGNGKQPS